MINALPVEVQRLAALLGGAKNPPVGRESLRVAAARVGTAIPAELITLLDAFDGGGPTDVDHGWIRFWPADEFEPATDSTAGRYDLPGAIVFADHGLHACWYAFQPGDGADRGTVCRLGTGEPETVASSLAEFLHAVVEGQYEVLFRTKIDG